MKQKQLYVLTECSGSLNMECKNNTAGANRSAAVRDLSVWLSWKGGPLISVLPAFAPQEGWPPVYGPPSLLLPPGSSCRVCQLWSPLYRSVDLPGWMVYLAYFFQPPGEMPTVS